MSTVHGVSKRWAHLDAPKRLQKWRQRIIRETQRAAAERIGIDHAKYNSFERGRARPCLDVAVRIEEVTGGYVRANQWAQAMGLDDRRSRAA
jgi:DNA-binding XRE family transcriptional regulator